MDILSYKKFKEINLEDTFFNSLKNDYTEFTDWFNRKATSGESAYVFEVKTNIEGFLYLKEENGPITDVIPEIKKDKVLKVGTMKINAHGTKLGERFIKKILDNAISKNIDTIYVTVFKKHESLINLYKKYGFIEYGVKSSSNGEECVLLKDLTYKSTNFLNNYPKISLNDNNKYVLGIYPKYHTKLFPDSILKNESYNLITDVSHTNSIHKIYVCSMNVKVLRPGDLILIYRTSDGQSYAKYRSVLTSVCTVEEVKRKHDFKDFSDFYGYSNQYSIFDRSDLMRYYNKYDCYSIKMTYNATLNKKVINADISDIMGYTPPYWGFFRVSDDAFNKIIEKGELNESFIID